MTAPVTKSLPAGTLLDDLHPTRFLKPSDLLDRWHMTEIVVTVAQVQLEEVEPKPKQKEWKPVLYFRTRSGDTFPRGYLISARADTDALKTATTAATIGDLIGRQIKIIVSEFRGAAVLRIDTQPVQPPARS